MLLPQSAEEIRFVIFPFSQKQGQTEEGAAGEGEASQHPGENEKSKTKMTSFLGRESYSPTASLPYRSFKGA